MGHWIIYIFVLVTSQVPTPRGLMIFGSATLVSYTFALSAALQFEGILGSIHPAAFALLGGYLAVWWDNIPRALVNIDRPRDRISTILALTLAISAACLFAPSLAWLQHGLTLMVCLYAGLFAWLVGDRIVGPRLIWFARDWSEGRENAAYWHVARLIVIAFANEALILLGSPTLWVFGIALGPIGLHYLMYWVIRATHPTPST